LNNGNGAVESHAGDGLVEHVARAPGEEMPPAPTSERVEKSGRKARGRKPLSPEVKAARANERAKAKLAAKKETKPNRCVWFFGWSCRLLFEEPTQRDS